MSSMVPTYFFFLFHFFLFMILTHHLSSLVSPALSFQLPSTATRENSILPLVKYVPSVQLASSNNKIRIQVFRAPRAQQDLSSHLKAPRLALILVVSNPPIVRMTSTSTRPLVTVRTVLQVAPALVPLTNQAFAHYLDGLNVPTSLSRTKDVCLVLPVLVRQIQL